ncbi:MAG: peptidylprolyl isomerase [Fibrobacteria bacterium]|nr:peptidylprolyl isomerase [Fibrobacteria bacterium]
MITHTSKIKQFTLLFTLFLVFCLPCMAKPTVVIKVENKTITKERIDSLVIMLARQQFNKTVLTKEERAYLVKLVAGNLVGQELLSLEATKLKISISSAETDSMLNLFKANFKNPSDFSKTLAQVGDTEVSLKKKLSKEMRIEKLLKKQLEVLTRPTEAEMKAFYQKHKKSFPINDTLRASQIVFNVSPKASQIEVEEKRKKLNKLRQALTEEVFLDMVVTQFSSMALQFSETQEREIGGDLGKFKIGDFFPAFDNVVKKMSVGEISEVFRSPIGLHIVLLTERNNGKYEDSRLKVMQAILSEKTKNNQKTLEKYLKTLMTKYKVTYYDKVYKGSLSAKLGGAAK